MPRRPYRLVSSRTIYRGRVIRLVKDRFRHDAAPDRVITRELVVHPGAVVVLPVLPGGKVLLVRQFRWAARSELWEVPAGTLEQGERPLACARRELEEETGFRASRWTFLARFYPAPGISDELMTLYRAEGLRPGRKHPDEDEQIEHQAFPFAEALRMARDGRIRDGKTLVALLWAARR